MTKTKISIIIPYRNVESYIGQCLDSVVNQTLKEIEIICVNDASSDKTQEIIEGYIETDDRFKHINLDKRQGQAYARNRALEIATGEYIGFVDSDDWVDLSMFEKLYEQAKETDADIAMCGANIYDEEKAETNYEDSYYSLELLNDKAGKIFSHKEVESSLLGINVSLWNKIYKKEFFDKIDIKFPEGYIYEDLPFFYKSFLSAERILFLKENLYYYRTNRPNSTMQDLGKAVLDRVPMVSLAYEYIINSDVSSSIKTELIGWIINDVFHRYTLVEGLYQKEFYFQMKSLFLSLDVEGIEEDVLKTFYCYKEYKLITEKSYDECNKKLFARYKDAKKMVKEIKAARNEDMRIIKEYYEGAIKKYELDLKQKDEDCQREKTEIINRYESDIDHVRFILKVVKKIKKIAKSILRIFDKNE